MNVTCFSHILVIYFFFIPLLRCVANVGSKMHTRELWVAVSWEEMIEEEMDTILQKYQGQDYKEFPKRNDEHNFTITFSIAGIFKWQSIMVSVAVNHCHCPVMEMSITTCARNACNAMIGLHQLSISS